jgi:hypothetical protein
MRYDRLWTDGYLAAGILGAVALMLAGCSAPGYLQADGLPGEQYLVGGGFMIDWKAPTEGTAYLVEKTSGKIIETRSLDAGDNYSFSVSSGSQGAEFERALGIRFSEARFMLYFQPADTKNLIP